MRNKRALAPNLMTVLNLLCGFLSVVFAYKGNYPMSAWLIIMAGIFDVLDGKIARFTAGHSDFGIQFDSLADVVSFGVAPAFLIYAAQMRELDPEWLGLLFSFLPLAAGAIRLARFNTMVSSAEKRNFTGMPIPSSAGLICSYVLFSNHFYGEVRFPGFTVVLLILAAYLMVSTIPFEAMPKFSLQRGKQNTRLIVLLAMALGLIVVFPEWALFPVALIYILMQLGRAAYHFVHEEEEAAADVSVGKR